MPHRTPRTTEAASALLPLKPVQFAVLLSLHGQALHGFAIMEHVNGQLNGAAIVGPGTLYRLLKDMRAANLIARGDPPAGASSDERRQYHSLTALGRDVVTEEAARLRKALAHAGHLGLAAEGQ